MLTKLLNGCVICTNKNIIFVFVPTIWVSYMDDIPPLRCTLKFDSVQTNVLVKQRMTKLLNRVLK